MLLVLLAACTHLTEGDYDIDYDPVKVDSCDIYQGGQVTEDGGAELSWDDATLVVELDGADEDMEFEVDGKEFTRETFGVIPLDDNCSLTTEQDDEGEMLSNTQFEGETRISGVLQGSCTVWEYILDTPCLVEFEWEGEYDD